MNNCRDCFEYVPWILIYKSGMVVCFVTQIAAVRCVANATQCLETQWQCPSSKACIAIEFLCDTVPDCSDGADENATHCQVYKLAIDLVRRTKRQ